MSAVLAQAGVADDATRYNIYSAIHKALRAFMSDTLVRVGAMDVADDGERAAVLGQLGDLLAACSMHLHHENEVIHPAIERARKHAAARTIEDHHHHEAAIADLEKAVERLQAASAELRPALAKALYLSLSDFVAENFSHMITEEVDNHAELIAAYDDAAILGLEQRIVASLEPEQKLATMRWMIPHINAAERAFLLGGMKRHAPPAVFAAVLGLARERLSQRDFFKLERALA